MVIDRAANPKAATGKFERIYHQPMTIPRYGGAADLVVKGYALPNEYFYKGTIDTEDSSSFSTPIFNYSNIKEVLNKLKRYNDYDIMMEPDDKDDDVNILREKPACAHITKSENELDTIATVITEQLDDLLERVTSGDTDGSITPNKLESEECLTLNSCSELEKMKSLTDIISLLKKSSCTFSTSTNINKGFRFSKLDDGQSDKNFVQYENLKNVLFEMDLSPLKNKKPPTNMNPVVSKTYNYLESHMTEATSKLLSFINEKEKENVKNWWKK